MNPSDMQSSAAARAEGAGIVGTRHARHSGPGPEVMAADTLQHNDVVSSDGKNLGKIKHIMLDVLNGKIAYAVLSNGGFLGIGDKLLAIPWAALTLNIDEKSFLLSATAALVKASPGFDKEQWPAMGDLQWAVGVHDYYRTAHYWEQEAFPEDGALNRVHQGPML